MNDTTFQGDGKIAFVPVVANEKPPKQTNADRIRAMTDEELAELCEDGCIPPERGKESWEKRCWGSEDEFPTPKEMCCKCWLEWLKQEANDET